MLEKGLIEESDERPDRHLDDERRRYYRITPLGLRAAQALAWTRCALPLVGKIPVSAVFAQA